jgi:DNA-binding beta-propeller fold protein YncE
VAGYIGLDINYRYQINGGPMMESLDGGYRAVIDLKLGHNLITVKTYTWGNKLIAKIQKYVILDPLCRLSNRQLLYMAEDDMSGTTVIDPVNNFVVGYLKGIAITAASPDGKYVVSDQRKFLPVNDPSVEKPWPFQWLARPLFSPDGRYAYCGYERCDLSTWKTEPLLLHPMYGRGNGSEVLTGGSLMTWEILSVNNVQNVYAILMDPSLAVTDTFVLNSGQPYANFSPNGNVAIADWYWGGEGFLKVGSVKTKTYRQFRGLCDFMGDVVFTPDSKWAIVGSYGNEWQSRTSGRLYVIELATRAVRRFAYCYGGNSLALSPDGGTLYATSRWALIYWECGYRHHRGVDVFNFKDGYLTGTKTYYLGSPNMSYYPPNGRLILKPAGR